MTPQDLPLEYNTWLLFRQAVDVILVKYVSPCYSSPNINLTVFSDFLSYCMFAFSCFRVPEDLSFGIHIMRSVLELLVFFTLAEFFH